MQKNTLILIIMLLLLSYTQAASIIGISIPVNSMDGNCHPKVENIWSSNPVNINSGIGYIINPTLAYASSDFTLHDHVYISSYIPDPNRAIVTYEFDEAVVVDSLQVIQHTNGVSRIEGFAGNSLSSMTSLGSVFGPSGDVMGGSQFSEYASQTFDFSNETISGKYFQFIVRKTALSNGWAMYRAMPNFTTAVPEPASLISLAFALAGLWIYKRSR